MDHSRYPALTGESPIAATLRATTVGVERPVVMRPRLSRLILGLITLLYVAVSFTPVILAAVGFTIMAPYFSLAGSARVINRELAVRPDAVVACEALPHTASSLLYYLDARVHWVNAPFDNQYAQRVLGEGRDYYWDDAGLLAAWNSPRPVYFIIEQNRLDYWQGLLSPGARFVSKSGTRLVLCNR